jgi:sugar lactone lactonase YvrE
MGNIYTSNRIGDGSSHLINEIIKTTTWGNSSVLTDLGPADPGGRGVLGLTTDPQGNVYAAFVACNSSHGVWKIYPDGSSIHLSGSQNIETPNALTFDNRGNLYVTDSSYLVGTDPGLVWIYRKQSGTFEIWASSVLLAPIPGFDPYPFPAPGANGIAFAPPNHVYVANNEKSLILDIPVLPDGSAGDITVVAAGGPPSILTAPDGLALDLDGNLYAAVPAAGLAPFPLSPVIKIYTETGDVEAIVPPYLGPSPLFDFPTSLAFGTGPLDKKSLFVVNPTSGVTLGSGPAITQVGVGVPGRTGQ